jgi:hypothetical protein
MCTAKKPKAASGMVQFEPPRAADDTTLTEEERRRLRSATGYAGTVATGSRGLLARATTVQSVAMGR